MNGYVIKIYMQFGIKFNFNISQMEKRLIWQKKIASYFARKIFDRFDVQVMTSHAGDKFVKY